MARNKNSDPLRRSGKHNDSTRDKYGHEHYEQIPLRAPNHQSFDNNYLASNDKGNPTKNKGK